MPEASGSPARRGRVLVVDDLERWRRELQKGLAAAGYHADAAGGIEEARERIASNLYHVLVLDVRMKESDLNDVAGMEWLRELAHGGDRVPPYQILMISAYGDKTQMREAFGQYGVADFLEKDTFRESSFIECVDRAVEKIKVNPGLIIHWQDVTAAGAVQGIRFGPQPPPGDRIKVGSQEQALAALELDDLLRRLFHDAESIIVSPLPTGHSGTGVLRVQPFYQGAGKGKARTVVLKFGAASLIGAEHARYEEFVKPFVGQQSTQAEQYGRTPRLGGIVYTFLGTDAGALTDFGRFYRAAEQPHIDSTLRNLFVKTCGSWYANRERATPQDLAAVYRASLSIDDEESLDTIRLEQIRSVQGKEELTFAGVSSDRPLPNPMLAMRGRRFLYAASACVGHGDLNTDNVLVDEAGNTWLIDFMHTGIGPAIRDIARFDTVVRTQLLAPLEATLQERCELEETFASVSRFSQLDRLDEKAPKGNAALARVFRTSLQLRRLAAQVIGGYDGDDMSSFFLACLYFGMGTIRYYRIPKIQREHGLLSASILARHFLR